MTRKRFSEKQVIETLFHQGVIVRCYRCKTQIRPVDAIEREHLHERGLGGPDVPENCRYSHKSCHDIVTNGTKATTAGSSKHRIAKAARTARKIAGTWRKTKRKIKSNPKIATRDDAWGKQWLARKATTT